MQRTRSCKSSLSQLFLLSCFTTSFCTLLGYVEQRRFSRGMSKKLCYRIAFGLLGNSIIGFQFINMIRRKKNVPLLLHLLACFYLVLRMLTLHCVPMSKKR